MGAPLFSKLRRLFGGSETPRSDERFGLSTLDPEERRKIGTDKDPLRGYEAAVERHQQAMEADQRGDSETAITLYQRSVTEGFVGSPTPTKHWPACTNDAATTPKPYAPPKPT